MKSGTVLAAAVLAGALAAGGTVAWKQSSPQDEPNRREAAWAFDVTDKQKVMAYSDTVFVGEVEGKSTFVADDSHTTWKVLVGRALKGSPAPRIEVIQLGVIEDSGRTRTVDGETLLTPGKTYLLATNKRGDGRYTLVAGPVARAAMTGGAQDGAVIADYRKAIAGG